MESDETPIGNRKWGCIPENVKLGLEGVELVVNGDFYTGSIRGLNHDKTEKELTQP